MKYSCNFYIVRHGETDWNVKGLIQGHSDIELNKKGEKQAKLLKKELRNIKFDIVFSSDLLRAKRTAEIIALEKSLVIQTTKVLRERSYGRFEGKSVDIIADIDYPDIESDEQIIARFLTFLRETAAANSNKTILVVCHGGIMRVLLSHLGFSERKDPINIQIENGGYINLHSDGIDFFIRDTKGIIKD